MNYTEIKELLKKKLGTSTQIKNIDCHKSSDISMNIAITVPFLNQVSDELMFYLITKHDKTFLTDDTWLDDDLETMGLYDNKKNFLKLKKYIQGTTNNGELPIKTIIYNKDEQELQMPINSIKDLPFSIEMFIQEIIEIIAVAQSIIINQ